MLMHERLYIWNAEREGVYDKKDHHSYVHNLSNRKTETSKTNKNNNKKTNKQTTWVDTSPKWTTFQ